MVSCSARTVLYLLLIVGSLSGGGRAWSADGQQAEWGGHANVGVTSWGNLGDLELPDGSSFKSMGWLLSGSVHRHVADWGSAEVLVGADMGFFGTDSNIVFLTEDLTQRALYLTPNLSVRFGPRDKNYLMFKTGIGWYKVDFAELDCDVSPCAELSDPFDESAFGGHVDVIGGLGRWLIVGLGVHYADFGEVPGFPEDGNRVKGPIYQFTVGFAFGR